jgi:hypothetical protein
MKPVQCFSRKRCTGPRVSRPRMFQNGSYHPGHVASSDTSVSRKGEA